MTRKVLLLNCSVKPTRIIVIKEVLILKQKTIFLNKNYVTDAQLQEAEATDTRTRMELEKKGRLNRENTPPLSFYEDAKHPNYDYYMENRGIIDKIKDSLYSFIKGSDVDEVSQESTETNQNEDNRLVDGRGRIELDNSSFSLKEKQLEIIQNSNSASDDYHTWIRSVDDIKTLEETLKNVMIGLTMKNLIRI